jgi:hypothetical protein
MSTGGPDYDGRKTAEARNLVQAAFRSYPQLAEQKRGFLERQMEGINLQQAEKDFNTAEFYKRTGHPGAAYFYYKLVEQRYPQMEIAKKAAQKAEEVRAKAAKENGGVLPGPQSPSPGVPTVPYMNQPPLLPGQTSPPPPAQPAPTTLPAPTPLPPLPGSMPPPVPGTGQ